MIETYTIEHVTKAVVPDTEFIDDKVFLTNEHYKNYFKKTFKSSGSLPWKRGIIKIKHECYVTRLMFHSGNSLGINGSQMGLPLSAMQILDVKNGIAYEFELSVGSRFLFMWNHPNHLTRIGFKYTIILGGLSVIIGFLSFSL